MKHQIRKVREIQSYSQIYVAEHLGISQPAYSNMENGKTKVTNSHLQQIAEALNVTPEVIIKFDAHLALQSYLEDNTNS